MDFSNYLFRSHAVGKIINVPKPLTPRQQETLMAYNEKLKTKELTEKQKKDWHSLNVKLSESRTYKLSESQKTLLSELAFAEKYNRKIEINSPKLTKGIECEKHSRDLLSRVCNIFLTSSDERKNNKWVTGAIDVEPNNIIIDIKSSWSWESYSKILQDKPNEIYLRQGDSYMDLWGIKDFLLCHTLVDTPFNLIDKEIRKLDYQNGVLNIEGDVRDENIEDVVKLISNHVFSRKGLEDFCDYSPIVHIEWFDGFVEIPEEKRVHMIHHQFDPIRIKQRNECIILAREHMNSVKPINNFQSELIQ